MEFLEKKIYVSPAPRKYLWLVGNQLPHLQTTDRQKNRRENPTTQSNSIPVRASSWFCFSYSGRRTMILRIILPHTRMSDHIFRTVAKSWLVLVRTVSGAALLADDGGAAGDIV